MGGGKVGERACIPEDSQADVYEQISAATSDEEDTDGREEDGYYYKEDGGDGIGGGWHFLFCAGRKVW